MQRWLVAFVVLVISGLTPTPPAYAATTTASAATFTYDATSVPRVDVHEIEGAVAFAALLSGLREGALDEIFARIDAGEPLTGHEGLLKGTLKASLERGLNAGTSDFGVGSRVEE